jgi:hypothetical protein
MPEQVVQQLIDFICYNHHALEQIAECTKAVWVRAKLSTALQPFVENLAAACMSS